MYNFDDEMMFDDNTTETESYMSDWSFKVDSVDEEYQHIYDEYDDVMAA